MRRDAYQWAAVSVGLLVWAAAASNGAAQAAGVGWEKQGGAFQACLDARAKAWLDAKVEMVVNEDPAAGEINDAAVASWTADALKECASKSGAASDPGSEQQFVKYMAHWHDHLFKAADELRRRVRPD